jgi:acetyl esterase/lipase
MQPFKISLSPIAARLLAPLSALLFAAFAATAATAATAEAATANTAAPPAVTASPSSRASATTPITHEALWKKYPLLVLIHGGAASSNPDQIGLRWNYHLLAAPGYVVLMTDYTGSTGAGEKFAPAIKLDPLKTPGDEINQAVDEALKRYAFIDGSRMCAAGASYGGHLANWIEATTTRYKCIISHAGEVDLTTQWGISDSIYGRELTNGGPPWAAHARPEPPAGVARRLALDHQTGRQPSLLRRSPSLAGHLSHGRSAVA